MKTEESSETDRNIHTKYATDDIPGIVEKVDNCHTDTDSRIEKKIGKLDTYVRVNKNDNTEALVTEDVDTHENYKKHTSVKESVEVEKNGEAEA
ncbi:hypothetical protein ACF0H5_013174 [Mactra antiquata]